MKSLALLIVEAAFSPKYLFPTNMVLAYTLAVTGDTLQQHLEAFIVEHKHDATRTRNMSAAGTTMGFFCHFFYKFLDRRFVGTDKLTIVKKLIVDQTVCSPTCLTIFFGVTNYMEGNGWDNFVGEMKAKAWKIYTVDSIGWPMLQFVNFRFMPPRYRVLYVNVVSILYNMFISYVKYDS